MTDLLPCPFCGRNQASIRLWSHEGGNKEYTLQCDECGVNVGSVGFTAANGDTRKAAVLLYKAWNTRAHPQTVDVEKLKREFLDKYIEHSNGNCDQCSYEAVSWIVDYLAARFDFVPKEQK